MKRSIRLPEDRLNEWLDQGTYYDWLYLAKAVRLRLARAVTEQENHGEIRLADALEKECRKIFGEW